MLKSILFPEPPSFRASLGLLAVRLVAGSALMFFGFSKIQKPFDWMGENAWAPGILQALAALSEFGGGLALILGLLMPLAGFGIACTMGVAASFHISRGDPFVGHGASFQPALLFLSIALLFLLAGPGRLSLDARIFRRRGPIQMRGSAGQFPQ